MKALDNFLIPFIGLKLGKHHFDFTIDRSFFESYQYDEFEDDLESVPGDSPLNINNLKDRKIYNFHFNVLNIN